MTQNPGPYGPEDGEGPTGGNRPPGGPPPQNPGPYGQPNPPAQGGSPYGYGGGQPYPQQSPPNSPPPKSPSRTSVEGKNFFAALFDFSFQSFVTVKFAKFIYAILIAFIILGYLLVVISAFSENAVAGLLVLLLGWIPAMIYLILFRITLEFMIALVRTSQNTAGTRAEIEALRSDLKNRG
ncbi:DUF4282 domain-containing protein [Nesterenkonia sp. Act20]|uniref:DUF4282 domain-containing protein n=1 Tax=Nesterenkonia sp. Act20 TaxID=1483432 RepID=UPI001C449C2E|nr:DUF4282 domain-containing protein [Nesterenkonia sp. Act20]